MPHFPTLFHATLLLVLTAATAVAQNPEASRRSATIHRTVQLPSRERPPMEPLDNTVKWEETFSGTALPSGWTVLDADSSGLSDSSRVAWELVQQVDFTDTTVVPESGQSFFFSSFLNANDNYLIDEWVITPLLPVIEPGDSLHFYAGAVDERFKDSLAVWVGTAPTLDSMISGVELAYFKVDGPVGAWTRYSFSLAEFAGQRVHVGVNYYHLDGGRFGNHSDHIWLDHFILTNDSTITTGVAPAAGVPLSFRLEQNYPNPFNPATTIAFELMAPERIRLEVLDLLGRRVATLVPERRQAAGRVTVRWDGRNDNGDPMPSAVYFYRLTGERFEQTRRMILLR